MTPERHELVSKLFLEACGLEPPKRSAFLDQVCEDDLELRRQVEALLAHDVETHGTFDREAATATAASDSGERPEQIGPYKILEQIGEGGMGVVYLADQQEPVRRRVALKIIKLGMDTKQVIARFEAERQALAMMDHPNVAKVFDAGATDQGRPYFVMEHVAGIPITEHCDKQRLSIEDRLQLFMQVCEAVQHAHQKGVIHRDLKPANILVVATTSAPKVIDFGVAKALHQPLTERTLFTQQGQLIGTPEYMSPEQAEMTAQAIDTRSDIYSLGVLLYELLTGLQPFEPTTLRKAGLAEVHRLIREVEPSKPSTKLSALGLSADDPSTTTRITKARRTDLRALTSILRHDLDWIVMKCLEKNRERRYDTANGLAMEIRRFLSYEPVLAGPPSVAYRARKFLHRNRWPVAIGVGFAILLSCGIVGTSIFAVYAAKARDQAREAMRLADLRYAGLLLAPYKSRDRIAQTNPDAIDQAACLALGAVEAYPLSTDEGVRDFVADALLIWGSELRHGFDSLLTMPEAVEDSVAELADVATLHPETKVRIGDESFLLRSVLGQFHCLLVTRWSYRDQDAVQRLGYLRRARELGIDAAPRMYTRYYRLPRSALELTADIASTLAGVDPTQADHELSSVLRALDQQPSLATSFVLERLRRFVNVLSAGVTLNEHGDAVAGIERFLAEQVPAAHACAGLLTCCEYWNRVGATEQERSAKERWLKAFEGSPIGERDIRASALAACNWTCRAALRGMQTPTELDRRIGIALRQAAALKARAAIELIDRPWAPEAGPGRRDLMGTASNMASAAYLAWVVAERLGAPPIAETAAEMEALQASAGEENWATIVRKADRELRRSLLICIDPCALDARARVLIAHALFSDAERVLLDLHRGLSTGLGPDHPLTVTIVDRLADFYDEWHRAEPGSSHSYEAESWRSRLGARAKTGVTAKWMLEEDCVDAVVVGLNLQNAKAHRLWDAGRFADAEEVLLDLYESVPARLHVSASLAESVVRLYTEWDIADPSHGHDAEAAEWRAKLEELNAQESAEKSSESDG